MKRIAIFVFMIITLDGAFAQYINLGEERAYVRRDFEQSWTTIAPRVDDPKWTLVKEDNKDTVLKMNRLGLPDLPVSGSLSFLNNAPKDFTVVIPFQATLDLVNSSDPALFIKEIGQQWAVYLNGVLVRNEFVAKGERYIERYLRNVVIPIDTLLIKNGTNILTFRLRGDPYNGRCVLDHGSSLQLGSYRSLSIKSSEYHIYILSGVYIFFALFQFILFLLRAEDKSSLFFGLAALLMGIFLFSRSTYAASLLGNTSISFHIGYFSLFLFTPALLVFLEAVLTSRISLWPGINAIVAIIFVVLGLIFKLQAVVNVWYLVALSNVLYAFVFVLRKSLVSEYQSIKSGQIEENQDSGQTVPKDKDKWFLKLILSPPGRTFLISVFFAIAIVMDIYFGWAYGKKSDSLTPFFFFIFVSLLATIPAERFSVMRARVDRINLGLEAEVEARTARLANAANELLELNRELSKSTEHLGEIIKESERDLRTAATVQKGFYSVVPPSNPEWDVAYIFEPLAGVSADFFDFYSNDGRLAGISIGTVSGAGIASGLLTVLVRNIMAHGIQDSWTMPVNKAMDGISHLLSRELSGSGSTVSCINFMLSGKKQNFVNSSYSPVLLKKRDSKKIEVFGDFKYDKSRPFLGQEGYRAESVNLELASGDAVFLYSAGMLNVSGISGNAFVPSMLMDSFSNADSSSADSLLASVILDYKNSVPQVDRKTDITAIMLLKR